MMKQARKLILWAVLAALMLSLCPAVSAETPSLFIPDRIKSLRLPEMPEIPEMPLAPELRCWMDLIADEPDCPKIADPDGYFHLQFDRQVEKCYVDGTEVRIDENGYGEIPAEETDMQNIDISVHDGNMWYDYRTPGELEKATGHFGKLTVYYNEYGCAYEMYLLVDEDFFRSGMENAVSGIRFSSVIIETPVTVGRKVKMEQTRVWYVSRVRADYPKGNYIREVIADYFNDEKKTLDSYAIGYDVTEEDRYGIYYSGRTYKCGSVLYEEDQILRGLYQDKGETDLLTVDLTDGTLLLGRLYKNASGKYFGSNRWVHWQTKKAYKGPKNLKRLFDFPSPREK